MSLISQEEFYKSIESMYKLALLSHPNKLGMYLYKDFVKKTSNPYLLSIRVDFDVVSFCFRNLKPFLMPAFPIVIMVNKSDYRNERTKDKFYNALIRNNYLEKLINIITDISLKLF